MSWYHFFVPDWVVQGIEFTGRRFGRFATRAAIAVGLLGSAGFGLWWNWHDIVTRPGVARLLLPGGKPTPQADPTRFAVIVADFDDDDGSYLHVIVEGLREIRGIQVLALGSKIPSDLSDTKEAQLQTRRAVDTAFEHTHAQILLWGRVLRAGSTRVLKLYYEPGPGLVLNDPSDRYTFSSSGSLELPDAMKQRLALVVSLIVSRVRAQIDVNSHAMTTEELERYAARVRSLADTEGPQSLLDVRLKVTMAVALADSDIMLSAQTRSLLWIADALLRLNRLLSNVDKSRDPADWGDLQYTRSICSWWLAAVLSHSGQEGAAEQDRNEAIKSMREALTAFTLERTPMQWAAANMGLAAYLKDVGVKAHDDPVVLGEAATLAKAALIVYTPECRPLFHWFAQITFAEALSRRGWERQDTTELHEALMAYDDLTRPFYLERLPGGWANAQSSRAETLIQLSVLEKNVQMMEDAGTAARSVVAANSKWITPDQRHRASEDVKYVDKVLQGIARDCEEHGAKRG
jgi:hypothetical protein